MAEDKGTYTSYKSDRCQVPFSREQMSITTAVIKSRNGNIKVIDRMDDQEDSLPKRCVVGYCGEGFNKLDENIMVTHFCSNLQTNTWRSKPYKGNGVGRTATSIWNGGTL
uniref:Putative ovule protein n=1 Tax=Solanum chacoense TaxID=4108 RepID=A0A0V0HPN3_SOLCH